MAINLEYRARNIAQYAAMQTKNMSQIDALNFKDRALCMLEDGRVKPNDAVDKAAELVWDALKEDA